MGEGMPNEDVVPAWDPNSAVPIAEAVVGEQSADIPTEMPLVPQFIREFSRENSQVERDELAGEIREKRRERDASRAEQDTLLEQQEGTVRDLALLQGQIEAHSDDGFFSKVANYLEVNKLRQEINNKLGEQVSLEDALAQTEDSPERDETRRMLADFYDGEKKKWTEAGYTKEDITKNFSEEHLASLSMEDYALLLQRFPGQMVTHVTRQGVRDHNEMFEHSAGMGEQHNGFKGILSSGRILSPLEVALSQAETRKDICRFLNDKKEPTENDVPGMVTRLKQLTDPKGFNNKTAGHYAVEGVVNSIYGGESGNETFVAYPSAFIASQTKFNTDPTKEVANHSQNHNDVYVWPDEGGGVSVNAGIVFIPKNASVDPATGSLYKADEMGNPVEDTGISEDERVINRLNFEKVSNMISSEEYWEQYFQAHPDQRPSKIVYYDTSGSPTQALWKWKAEHAIVNKNAADSLGFSENQRDNEGAPVLGDKALRGFNQIAVDSLVAEYGLTYVLGQYNQGWSSDSKDMEVALNKMYKNDEAQPEAV